MKPWLFTPYKLKPKLDAGSSVQQVLSVFLVRTEFDAEEFDADLVRQLETLGPVDAIHFVGFDPEIFKLQEALRQPDGILIERLRSVTGDKTERLLFFSFDTATGIHTCVAESGAAFGDAGGAIDLESRNSLIAVFRKAGGEERAPIGTHYAKTSDRHCDRFLRVSNVLEDGRNVGLIAFWLLPRVWKSTARNVVVDTSGIYSVALTALQQVSRLGGLTVVPQVWSHRSHEGVQAIPSRIAEEALFLVSASTSHGLAKKLIHRGARPERITTLFSLAPNQADGHTVLCDLQGDDETGLKAIENQVPSDCSWCRRHFHLIGINGDQFTIAPPRVNTIEIRATDIPDRARAVLSSLAGLKAFFAYRRRDGERLCSVGIDVAPILLHPIPEKSQASLLGTRNKWASMVRRSQTLTLRNIVAASYPRSDELAGGIFEAVKPQLADASNIRVVQSSRLRELPTAPGTTTLVISACVDEAQELLSVSRTLRDIQDGGTTSYLSVAQLLAPKSTSDRLKSNLTYGSQGEGTFSYLTAIDLAIDAYEDEPSWRAELTSLQRFQAWTDGQELDLPPEVEARIERLKQAPARGMQDDLFWANAQGQPLRLRSDFTLIDGALRDPQASQADLFAIFSLLLTGLRNNADPSRRLAHNAYERSVLSPSNFDRFNDGVLQACLLRASRPKDLAYGACEMQLSEQMLGFLMDMLPDPARPERSDALIEFLIALTTVRMTIAPTHLRLYVDALALATENRWPTAWLLGKYLRNVVLEQTVHSAA